MKNEQAQVFLSKMKEKIYNGEYDLELTIPFMSKKLLFATIKSKVDKKIESGARPLLSEKEINEAIEDVKETAVTTMAIFLKAGIVKSIDEGYVVNESLKRSIRGIT